MRSILHIVIPPAVTLLVGFWLGAKIGFIACAQKVNKMLDDVLQKPF
jgi:hypothetical protein